GRSEFAQARRGAGRGRGPHAVREPLLQRRSAAVRDAHRDLPRPGRGEAVPLPADALLPHRREGGGTGFVLKFLVLLALAFPVCAAERILDFHSSIRIDRNGALTITERIEVQAEGSQLRRGIL